MKSKFTLLSLLFSCLRLSVFAVHPDTTKLKPQEKQHADTIKLLAATARQDGSKLTEQIILSDSLRVTTPLINTDYISKSTTVKHRDSLKLIQTVSHQGGIRLSASLINAYSVKIPAPLPYAYSKKLAAALYYRDSVKQQIRLNQHIHLLELLEINNTDSLKRQVKHIANDTLKALFYTRIAANYLTYDTLTNKRKQLNYQNEAISYTLLAIQQYASYNDSTALRMSFDNLAKVYYSQKKYSQAKWFVLQSNSLSRAKNDVPNIISSLITLSLIKSDIKDYNLAMQDLDEALQLSILSHSPKTELEVLKNYAFLYNKLQNYPKEALVLKKRDSLVESMRKDEEAKLAVKTASQKKKLDSLQNKKKLYTVNLKKSSKNTSSKKAASL
jgi:tetratricopeptide (TPR) repeat protein